MAISVDRVYLHFSFNTVKRALGWPTHKLDVFGLRDGESAFVLPLI